MPENVWVKEVLDVVNDGVERLTTALHETERERARYRDLERKTAQTAERYRKALPAGVWRTISVPEFAAHHGFPADPDLDDQHTARDGSQWTFDGDRWELREYAPDDLAQLLDDARAAQEAAEREVKRLKEKCATWSNLSEAQAQREIELSKYADEALSRLPEPDKDNPAHVRFALNFLGQAIAKGLIRKQSTVEYVVTTYADVADRLEAAQAAKAGRDKAIEQAADLLRRADVGDADIGLGDDAFILATALADANLLAVDTEVQG